MSEPDRDRGGRGLEQIAIESSVVVDSTYSNGLLTIYNVHKNNTLTSS